MLKQSRRFRPGVESLEQRLTPTNYSVSLNEKAETTAVAGVYQTIELATIQIRDNTPVSALKASINWGDNTASTSTGSSPVVTFVQDPQFSYIYHIEGKHAYQAGVSFTYHAYVTLQSSDGSQTWNGPEGYFTYVSVTAPVSLPGLPDLATAGLNYKVPADEKHTVNGPLPVNQIFNVTFTVKDLAAANAGAFQVSFYLSLDKSINPRVDRLLTTYTFAGLAGHGTATHTIPVRLPANLARAYHGDVYLGMVIDSNNHVREVTKKNNSNRGISFDVRPVTLFDPIFKYVTSTLRFKTKDAAIAYLEKNGFEPTRIIGTDAGWSKPIAHTQFSWYTGRVMPVGAFRIQAGPRKIGSEWTVIMQGTPALGEPSPRAGLQWGLDLISYVFQYHDHF